MPIYVCITVFSKGKWYDEKTYVVFASQLQQLMSQCHICGGDSRGEEKYTKGAFVMFDIICLEVRKIKWVWVRTCDTQHPR